MASRRYDREFKLKALTLLEKGDETQAAICRNLGIPESTMDGWKKNFKDEGDKAFPGSGNVKASNAGYFEIQKELENVKQERDILKKALAIFSRQK